MFKKIKDYIYIIYKDKLYNEYKDRLYHHYKNDLLSYYIKQELPFSEVDSKNRNTIESLANLYESEGYRTYAKMLGNYKNRLGGKLMKVDATENRSAVDSKSIEVRKFSDKYWRGFYNGQAYFISYILTLIKRNHVRFKNDEKKEEKENE